MPQPTTASLPVYLLTGFLGSGKTSLLNRLVHSRDFADTAVIINEFGAVGLDHVLIEKSNDMDVVLLDSGCLCCASNSPLQDSLEDLYYRRLRGEVPAFSRVVVETSGLADPLPLLNALSSSAEVARHYHLGGVLTTFDAVHGPATLAQYNECAVQLAVADRVVLTKTDIANHLQAEAALAALQGVNPEADVMRSTLDAGIDPLRGLEHHPQGEHHAAGLRQATSSGASPFGHLLRHGIASHVLRTEGTVDWARYAQAVQAAQQVLGERLLRAKGILKFPDGVHAVNGVRHLFSTPRPMNSNVPAEQLGALVLITAHADRQDIEHVARALGARIVDKPALARIPSSLSLPDKTRLEEGGTSHP